MSGIALKPRDLLQFHVKPKCGTNPVHHENLLALRRLDGILISGEIFRYYVHAPVLLLSLLALFETGISSAVAYQIILNVSGGPQCALLCSGLVELGYVYN